MKKQKHVIPVISIEGRYEETDLRRGSGVFKKVQKVMGHLKNAHIYFGTSMHAAREALDYLAEDNYDVDAMRIRAFPV